MESLYQTAQTIGQHLQTIDQPFTRDRVFKNLQAKGLEITKAAVSGWFNRAVRRGDLVSPLPGQYCLKGYEPSANQTYRHSTKILSAVAQGAVHEFELISGAGGLLV
jgi:hypothetical protein